MNKTIDFRYFDDPDADEPVYSRMDLAVLVPRVEDQIFLPDLGEFHVCGVRWSAHQVSPAVDILVHKNP